MHLLSANPGARTYGEHLFNRFRCGDFVKDHEELYNKIKHFKGQEGLPVGKICKHPQALSEGGSNPKGLATEN